MGLAGNGVCPCHEEHVLLNFLWAILFEGLKPQCRYGFTVN